mmetsp:Transcript_4732/g.18921  ORF Transcript_4732/g.18921 Transcript_4732/m.18921 type:complete len:108 (+) Transcript_4732:1260-1583(+)
MHGADLSGVNLQGVNLGGPDLRGAGLSGTVLKEAVCVWWGEGGWMTASLCRRAGPTRRATPSKTLIRCWAKLRLIIVAKRALLPQQLGEALCLCCASVFSGLREFAL